MGSVHRLPIMDSAFSDQQVQDSYVSGMAEIPNMPKLVEAPDSRSSEVLIHTTTVAVSLPETETNNEAHHHSRPGKTQRER
jgi:hypothetical protein